MVSSAPLVRQPPGGALWLRRCEQLSPKNQLADFVHASSFFFTKVAETKFLDANCWHHSNGMPSNDFSMEAGWGHVKIIIYFYNFFTTNQSSAYELLNFVHDY